MRPSLREGRGLCGAETSQGLEIQSEVIDFTLLVLLLDTPSLGKV